MLRPLVGEPSWSNWPTKSAISAISPTPPPAGWSLRRKQHYFDWAKAVIDALRGVQAFSIQGRSLQPFPITLT